MNRVIFEKKDGTMQHGVVPQLDKHVRLVIVSDIFTSTSPRSVDFMLTDIYEGIIAVYKEI